MVMLKRRIKKTIMFFIIFSTIIICINSYKVLSQNKKVSEAKIQEQQILKEIAIENQKKLDEELLRAKIVNSQNFVKSISNEIEIILLKQNGDYIISHDRTPQNNWYSEWANNAELTIKLDYRTIFSIKTQDLQFTITPEGAIKVNYDAGKIAIAAIDISNVIPNQKVSIFGSAYKPTEVTALENIAKDKIKDLSYTDDNILQSSNNLKSFINDMATKFGIDDISIYEV
jgi:glutaredoxin-related protein